jgi:hypothetical protein
MAATIIRVVIFELFIITSDEKKNVKNIQ